MSAWSNPYLDFVQAGTSASGKTAVWDVRASGDGSRLGQVRWFGRWRQYALFPEAGTVFNEGCMVSIAAFCKAATQERPRVEP